MTVGREARATSDVNARSRHSCTVASTSRDAVDNVVRMSDTEHKSPWPRYGSECASDHQEWPIIVRHYEPVHDLDERLARIYAMLSVLPFPGDDVIREPTT
jgi:hypothetical protein